MTRLRPAGLAQGLEIGYTVGNFEWSYRNDFLRGQVTKDSVITVGMKNEVEFEFGNAVGELKIVNKASLE